MFRNPISIFVAVAALLLTVGTMLHGQPPEALQAHAEQSSVNHVGNAPATQPSPDERARGTAAAVTVLHELLENKSLQLSTDRGSAAEKFQLSVRLARGTANGQGAPTDLLVVRDGDDVGILCRSAAGLPYCYMTKDLFLRFNPERPGELLVFRGGSPSFILGTDAENTRLVLDLSYRSDAKAPTVMFDAAALFKGALKKLKSADLDTINRAIHLRTDKSIMEVLLPDPADGPGFSLKALAMKSDSGSAIVISNFALNDQRPLALTGVTARAVLNLGLPTRPVAAEDVEKLRDLYVPADFGSDTEERKAALKLMDLFDPALRHEEAKGPRA